MSAQAQKRPASSSPSPHCTIEVRMETGDLVQLPPGKGDIVLEVTEVTETSVTATDGYHRTTLPHAAALAWYVSRDSLETEFWSLCGYPEGVGAK